MQGTHVIDLIEMFAFMRVSESYAYQELSMQSFLMLFFFIILILIFYSHFESRL